MLYPVVYDADRRSAILDAECPQGLRFSLGEPDANKLMQLISTLHDERSQQVRTKKTPGKIKKKSA